ncbi:MAG: hypothetical protein H7069_12445 [Phormidesmis sp. FL-bin-119]|nr:hypothetical protein [Pedobacter sp.]
MMLALPIVIITILFACYHRLNSFKPVKQVEIESLAEVNRKVFELKIKDIPSFSGWTDIQLVQRYLSISLSLPEYWIKTVRSDSSGGIRFAAPDRVGCVDLLDREDRMPLLEAAMDSPLMWLKSGIPYAARGLVETSIDARPALVGHVRLHSYGREKTDEVYVPNALIVLDNRVSIVLRACEGTPDDVFYQIYKSLNFRML